MKKRICFLLILALVFCGCAQKTPAQTTAATEATKAPLQDAPDFTVYDLEGKAVKLSDFEGKPVVLNFWASWCGPCKAEMPDFDETCKKLEGKVQFVMVNLTDGTNETTEGVASFLADTGYSFPVYCDTTMEAAITYNIQSIPTTFFIDKEGKLVAFYSGTMSPATLDQGISMIYQYTE